MQKLKTSIVCIFLLFTSTGIQSNGHDVDVKPSKEENTNVKYSIKEFESLEKAIITQIKLNQTLDSLSKTK